MNHGQRSTYVHRGCRCDECRAAEREYRNDYRYPTSGGTDLPLTATDLEIHRRLSAGQPIPHILEVGRYKRSWSHADVLRVADAWQQLATRNTEDNVRAEQRAYPEPEGAVQLPVRLTIACEHIVCGWTDDEIARALHVAPKTATRYRRMVAGALGVPVRDIAAAIHSGRISVQGVAA